MMATTAGSEELGRVLVAVSGKLDSAVAAGLLKNQGYEVEAIHFVLSDPADRSLESLNVRCCRRSDLAAAKALCSRLGIPLHVIDLRDAFKSEVVDHFVHERLQQRIPNACLKCHRRMRFDTLYAAAARLNFPRVATGHYAQVVHEMTGGMARLTRAADASRDQTYFLHQLSQGELQRTLFPLGGLTFPMIAKLAEKLGVEGAPADDTLCFALAPGERAYVESHAAPALRPDGRVRTQDGELIGEHRGLYRYTIGEPLEPAEIRMDRRGVTAEGMYVTGFDRGHAVLVIGKEELLYHREVMAEKVSWVRPTDGLRGLRCTARVAPGPAPEQKNEVECLVTQFENDTAHVEFMRPLRALMPGQAVVFYQGDDVLGGALIEKLGSR